MIGWVIFVIGCLAAWFLLHRSKVLPPNSPLVGKEKVFVFISLMASSFVGLFIFYFGWRNTFPSRKRVVVILFLFSILADIVVGGLLGGFFATINIGLIKQAAQAKNLQDCLSSAGQVKEQVIATSLQNVCYHQFATTTSR